MTVRFTLAEVLAATKGQCMVQGEVDVFAGVSTDTRTLQSGSLFVALSGDNFDGHGFVQEALRKGAAGLIVSRMPSADFGDAAVFLVPDTRHALQDLARFHRCRFRIPLIAVTGSNGKTSTKDMIASVLSKQLNILKTEANFNNEIGLSQTLLKISEDHQAIVVEMGMRGRGEIAELAGIAMPTLGVVTNVGETHLERLGSIANIAAAKSELIEALGAPGVAVLNGDDPYVRKMGEKTAARVVYYGMNPESDVRASNLKQSAAGISFECAAGIRSFPVTVHIPGIHNVYNALAAIAVGLELGLEPELIVEGLSKYEPGKMRLNTRQYGEVTVIDDTYNASPLSMAAAIDVLESVARGRKLAAIGDMLELGASAQAAHEAVGQHLASAGVNFVLTLGKLARVAGEAARRNGVPVVIACGNHDEAIAELRKWILPGDTLLIKGSRGMAMEKLLDLFSAQSEG